MGSFFNSVGYNVTICNVDCWSSGVDGGVKSDEPPKYNKRDPLYSGFVNKNGPFRRYFIDSLDVVSVSLWAC